MQILTGYKSYITAAVLIVIAGLAIVGIEIPTVSENTDPGALIVLALGLIFNRNGAKTEANKVATAIGIRRP